MNVTMVPMKMGTFLIENSSQLGMNTFVCYNRISVTERGGMMMLKRFF